MSSMFKLNNVLVSESASSRVGIDDIVVHESDDFNYMAEAYRFLEDYNRCFYNANKTFYKTILESHDSPEIINEAFSDFFDKAREIIEKFLNWLKGIVDQFITRLHQMVKSESYLKKNKKLFSEFSSEDAFEYKGFKFTYLYENSDIPKSVPQDISAEIGSAFQAVGSEGNPSNKDKFDYENLKAKYEAWQDDKEEEFDKFRAWVLGENDDTITSDIFDEECFAKFRDDSQEKSEHTMESSDITDALRRFENYEDLKKSINKTKQNIENDYKALEKYLDKSYKFSKHGFTIKSHSGGGRSSDYVQGVSDAIHSGNTNMDKEAKDDSAYNSFDQVKQSDGSSAYSESDVKNAIENYMRAMTARVQTMSNIHTTAFSAKLAAAKDCFEQDKDILYKALAKIQARKGKKK